MQEVVVKQEALSQGDYEDEEDDSLKALPPSYYEKDELLHLEENCADGFSGDVDLVTGTLSLMTVRFCKFYLDS